VVGHQVGHDADAAIGGVGHQRVECGQIAEQWVDIAVISDVVTPVVSGRGIEGRHPDEVDPEVAQVTELGPDAG